MSNRPKKSRRYGASVNEDPPSLEMELASMRLFAEMFEDMVVSGFKRQIKELTKWANLLAGDRCECVNVFLTAGGVRYTQCAPCAYREWLSELEETRRG